MSAASAPAGPPSSARAPELDGAVTLLGDCIDVVRERPLVAAVFLVSAPIEVFVPVLGSLAGFVVQTGAVVVVAETLTSNRTRADSSLGVRFIVAFVASLVAGVAVLVGLVLLVVPGLYLAVRLYLVLPAVMLDDRGPLEACGESWARTAGNSITIAGVVAATVAAALLAGAVAVVGAAGGVDPAVERLAAGETAPFELAVSVVGGLLTATTTAVVYVGTDG